MKLREGWMKIFLVMAISVLTLACSKEKKKELHAGHTDKHSSMLTISAQDRLLANIRSGRAEVKNIFETTTLVGTSAIDERKVDVITSRVRGRIDELYVKNPGDYVRKGQAIYGIYSEELLADEHDFLLAIDQFNSAISQKEIAGQLLEAARKKLVLWTLSPSQIKALEHSKRANPIIRFYAESNGYIIGLPIRAGEYVEVGTPVLKLADFNSLWVETQVYSEEVKYLRQNPSLQIEFEAYPNEMFTGKIVFDNPTLEEDQKVNLVRVQVMNPAKKLKPGMMAYLYLKRNEKKTLVIPKSALLMESMISVWVETNDGMFEQRMVTVGMENKQDVEILSGIRPGEKVVVSGAFFLKSESLVRQSGGSMGGMKM